MLDQRNTSPIVRFGTPRAFLERWAREVDIPLEVITGPSRLAHIVAVRAVAMREIRDRYQLSYPVIARLFRRLDHSTVIHACRRASSHLEQYPWLRAALVRINR